MKYLYSLILVVIITLFSCSNKDMSEREENIFKQPYQQLLIPVDSINTLGDLTDFLTEKYCVQKIEQWPYLLFDMDKKIMVGIPNRNTIKVGVEPPPCFEGQFDDKMVLEIIKDGYNTEIERIITEIDSIPSFVEKQMLSFGSDYNYAVGAYNNGIWLSTSRTDKLSNLNSYLYQIIRGYLSSLRKYSQMAYLKEVDKLSVDEYTEIANEFVFRLSFKYTDKPLEVDNALNNY
ncbi:MAG: hypothetical protein KAG84_02185 [Bacteroidales bacterium]|nr:hypothetical protein [Bacteroidales bacterium]